MIWLLEAAAIILGPLIGVGAYRLSARYFPNATHANPQRDRYGGQ